MWHISLQVEDVDRKFVELSELEARAWQETTAQPLKKKSQPLPRKKILSGVTKPAVSGSQACYWQVRIPTF